MANLSLFFQKMRLGGKMPVLTLDRDTAIITGVAALSLLLLLVLAFDGYSFYSVFIRSSVPLEESALNPNLLQKGGVKNQSIAAEKIERLTILLDRREQKFREILGK